MISSFLLSWVLSHRDGSFVLKGSPDIQHIRTVPCHPLLNNLLDQLEGELLSGSRTPDHESLYNKYSQIKQAPVRGVTLTPKQDAINEAKKNYGSCSLAAGAYFVTHDRQLVLVQLP